MGNWHFLKECSFKIWLCIFFVMISCSNCETFSTQMTDAFVSTFALSEYNADLLMSMTSVCGIFLCPIWGYIASQFGGLTYFGMASQIAMILASMILGYSLFISVSNNYLKYGAWISMLSFVLSQEWYIASAFTMLYSECPIHLVSVINSITAMLYLFGGVITTYSFGIIADKFGYSWSNMMMALLACIGLIVVFIIHCLDKQNDKNEETKKKRNSF